MQNQQVVG